jgi:hypothetical protein
VYICTGNDAKLNYKIMKNLRTATSEDFKVGARLISSEGFEFVLTNQYDNGVWECRKRTHMVSEAAFYKVAL